MKRECVTAYYLAHSKAQAATALPDKPEVSPKLTVCVIGTTLNYNLIQRIEDEVGPTVALTGKALGQMISVVSTPWWMLLYDNETMTDGLIAALPQLLVNDYDAYTFFRRPRANTTTIEYHTRLINSRMPYDIVGLRPARDGKFTRILNGWVLYDQNQIKAR